MPNMTRTPRPFDVVQDEIDWVTRELGTIGPAGDNRGWHAFLSDVLDDLHDEQAA